MALGQDSCDPCADGVARGLARLILEGRTGQHVGPRSGVSRPGSINFTPVWEAPGSLGVVTLICETRGGQVCVSEVFLPIRYVSALSTVPSRHKVWNER